MTEEKPVAKGRRTFLATAAGTIIGAIVTGVGVWALTPKEAVPVEVTKTVTAPGATVTTTAGAVTITSTVTAPGATATVTAPGATATVTAPGATATVTAPGVPVAVVEGLTVTERALNGVKKLKAEGKIVAPARVKGLVYAGTAGSYTQWKEQWEAATGTELIIEIVPIEESYDKLMLEATSKTGEWDFFATDYAYRGDFWEGGLVKDLTEWTWKYDPILYGEPDGVLYPLDKQGQEYMYRPDGRPRIVSLAFDGDVHCMYIRRDLMEDPKEKEGFEKQYGHPLKVPETWEEYAHQVEWFNRPPDLYGNAELKSLWWAINQWLMRYASRRYPFMPMFDEEFHPLIDGPEGIWATEQHVDMFKKTSPDMLVWGWAEKYAFWCDGKAYIDITYPSMGKFMELPEVSKVVGKNKKAVLPGSWVETPAGKVLNRTTTHDGTQVLYVNNYSKNPELAYCFIQFVGSPENIVTSSIHPAGFTDFTRYTQFRDPRQAEAWGKGEIGLEYLRAAAGSHRFMIPGFNFGGGWEYRTTLDRNLQEAIAERITPEQCMKTVAAEWEKVTERIGRDKMIPKWKWVLSTFPVSPL